MALTTQRLHRFFRQVSAELSEAVMLGGSAEPSPLNQWVIMGLHAKQALTLQNQTLSWQQGDHQQNIPITSPEQLFQALDQARAQARTWPDEKRNFQLPMAGGLVGCLGYEFYRWCDPGWQNVPACENVEWPELQFYEFQDWLLINLETQALHILTEQPDRKQTYQTLWDTALTSSMPDIDLNPNSLNGEQMADYLTSFQVSFQPSAFAEAVAQLKQDIYNGEIYQANLSMRLSKALHLDPYALYERLCLQNPSPFAGFWKTGQGLLVCNSPERLVQTDAQRTAQTRPIAGTRGRGATPAEDWAIGESLLANEKERAEHLMLVDLARNDLGRVCEAGSVQVNDFLALERYSHVTHLVSNVIGRLKAETTDWQLIQSVFPGGTITGCPKVRCVDILNRIEPVSRGLYTGSLGYFDAASPALDLNILIRSVYLSPTALPMRYNTAVHVGAGIVHDAIGSHEYRECLRKANAILNALHQLENSTLSPV